MGPVRLVILVLFRGGAAAEDPLEAAGVDEAEPEDVAFAV